MEKKGRVVVYQTERHKKQDVNITKHGYDRRGKEYIRCKERRGLLIIGTHCDWIKF